MPKRLIKLAEEALKANVAQAASASVYGVMDILKQFPFTCRKAALETPLLRELIIHFCACAYVALCEIEEGDVITLIAFSHQREEDFFKRHACILICGYNFYRCLSDTYANKTIAA